MGKSTQLTAVEYKVVPDPQFGSLLSTDRRGKGARGAVLDSGCSLTSGLRRGTVIKDFVAELLPPGAGPAGLDEHPFQHGTIVGSLVRRYAPKAEVAICKVGTARGPVKDAVVMALVWAAYEWNADVINLSIAFGHSDACAGGGCMLCNHIAKAVADGHVIVAAAGNKDVRTKQNLPTGCPTYVPGVVVAGAMDENRQYATFNSDLPPGLAKPVLLAPGTAVSAFGSRHPGTSFAAPVITAAVALIGAATKDYRGAVEALRATAVSIPTKVPLSEHCGLIQVSQAWEEAHHAQAAGSSGGQ